MFDWPIDLVFYYLDYLIGGSGMRMLALFSGEGGREGFGLCRIGA